MTDGLVVLCATGATIGFLHTLLGPDHYLPFVAMSRVGRWSMSRTVLITVLCGVGHVLSSVVLGIIGIAFGVAVLKLETIESFRGDIAGWLLLAFGLVYFVWGVRRAIRNKPHEHRHAHANGTLHSHEHGHRGDHVHAHTPAAPEAAPEGGSMTPWVLFTIFLFGPCEPLIPILMYPAATGSVWGLLLVTAVFGAVTIGTMMGVVMALSLGVKVLPVRRLERYTHALAGAAISLCGAAMIFLGL